MMDNSKVMSFQKELQNIVEPLSLKEPPFTQTSSEINQVSINLNHNSHQHKQIRKSMSQSSSQGRRTQAPQDEFDNMHQLRVFKTEANIKDSASNKGIDDDGLLFKCSAYLCMCLPGFGGKSKASKQVKAVKGENEKVHSVNHVVSSTFSFEKFELDDSGVTQGIIMNNENHGDESISSYFELPSHVFKCSDGAQSHPVTTTFLLDQGIKEGDQI